MSAAITRFTKSNPCPICSGWDDQARGKGLRCFGYLDSTGDYARCTREDYAGGLPVNGDETYSHRLTGACRCGAEHGTPADPAPRSQPSLSNIAETYDYTDETGTLLFQVVRFEPKRFLQRRPDPGNPGEWIWKLGDTRRVPYHLHQLVEADPSTTVYVVEGEKDVHAVERAGGVATCNSEGAGKWSAVSEHAVGILAGRSVVVVQDKDDPGRRHACEIVASLAGVAASVELAEALTGKDISDHLDAGHTLAELVTGDANHDPVVEPEDGAVLLDATQAFVRRYIHLSGYQSVAVALWIVHTHAAEAAEFTPYLTPTSAEKRSGKSRLLGLLAYLVRNPLAAANTSTAALFRSIEEDMPTVLFDETDATFTGNGGEREQELRGILNAGFQRGTLGTVLRTVGPNHTPKRFPVFCPKALAGIGKLPDTIADRAILIRMKRKGRGDRIERMRARDVAEPAADLKARLVAWANPWVVRLTAARPEIPHELDDRSADVWEPLFAIADAAGARWPKLARDAAVDLSRHREDEDEVSLGVRLLADVKKVFTGDRMTSRALVAALIELEMSPWSMLRDKPLSQHTMSRILGEYDVRSGSIKMPDGSTPKGFHLHQFTDAWMRYCPELDDAENAETPPTVGFNSQPRHLAAAEHDLSDLQLATEAVGCDLEAPPNPNGEQGSGEVATLKALSGAGEVLGGSVCNRCGSPWTGLGRLCEACLDVPTIGGYGSGMEPS